MKLLKLIFFIIFIISFVQTRAQTKAVCIRIAEQSLQWLNNGQSDSLYQNYDTIVSEKLSAEITATIWKQITSQMGALVKVDTLVVGAVSGNLIVDQVLEFEKSYLKYRLNFNAENKIAGIFFIPYRTAQAAAESTKTFDETEFSFVNDGIEFPAILCTPKNMKSKAIVILVHGSGPNDMDETIGPNKIFKQIANKLAAYGIASIRYHKRSFLAQQGLLDEKLKTDINHIVVNDAIAAADYASRIDSLEYLPRIIVGHSLGAYMAPAIAQNSSSVDAIIMLAANARPLEDLIIEQYKYIYSQDGISDEEKKEIQAMKKKVADVKKLEEYIAKGEIVELPLIKDTDFWLSLNKYKPLAIINNLQMPVLIMQGVRDYQVSVYNDFNLWYCNSKEAQSKDQTFIAYKGLNHLFIAGDEKSFPQEYNEKGDVSQKMISDMANWIINIWDANSNISKINRGIVNIREK